MKSEITSTRLREEIMLERLIMFGISCLITCKFLEVVSIVAGWIN